MRDKTTPLGLKIRVLQMAASIVTGRQSVIAMEVLKKYYKSLETYVCGAQTLSICYDAENHM